MASLTPSIKPFITLFSVFSFLSCLTKTTEALKTYTSAQESDRVFHLPGQPTKPSLSQFAGYITVNEDHGRALFYWFFEAESQPSKKPLLLWLNGGPGCSSVGYGAASELGPLRVTKGGIEFNNFAWHKEANLLFVESPVGVGFSYTNTSSDLSSLNDNFVAEDAYSFLFNWLNRFPQFKSHDFFISGESYAGHYVPQLAELIYDRNKDTKKYQFIKFKGFMIGNPLTEDYYDSKGLLEYAWSHSVISDQEYEQAKQVCNFKISNWTSECNTAMGVVFRSYNVIDIYNIYAPHCFGKSSSLSNDLFVGKNTDASHSKGGHGLRQRIPAGYDPCYETYTEEYLNRVDVQSSLHAKVNGTWEVCNDSLFGAYNMSIFSVIPIYNKLIKAGLKIWIYSGDADGRVPVIGSRYWVESLGLPLKTAWQTWYHNKQVGGRIVEYEGITLVTVRGAGHLVPLNKPSEALALIHSYLSGEDLPLHR